MTVDLGCVFCPFGGLVGAPEVTAEKDGLLGCGWGPRMQWLDCLANFGPLQLDCTFWSAYLFRTYFFSAPRYVIAGFYCALWYYSSFDEVYFCKLAKLWYFHANGWLKRRQKVVVCRRKCSIYHPVSTIKKTDFNQNFPFWIFCCSIRWHPIDPLKVEQCMVLLDNFF